MAVLVQNTSSSRCRLVKFAVQRCAQNFEVSGAKLNWVNAGDPPVRMGLQDCTYSGARNSREHPLLFELTYTVTRAQESNPSS